MKIVNVVGARPQFIKVKPIIDELNRREINNLLVHTGQHYDYEMSKVFFDGLNIPNPDYNLGVGSSSHGQQTAEMLNKLETLFLDEKPDIVIVYGDTNSTLAASLAASKIGLPIAHIEAGLRSYRKDMPEEINRVLTDHISSLLFCPTETAVKNLYEENINRGIHHVGDIMFDVFKSEIDKPNDILQTLSIKEKEYYLLTMHREENTKDSKKVETVLKVLENSGRVVVFPVHPRVKGIIEPIKNDYKNIKFIEPVGYQDMINLEKNAIRVLTDSGGMQKEAYFAKVPCITLREETEWVETLDEGWNIIVGTDPEIIQNALAINFNLDTQQKNYFGDGQSAQKTIEIILESLQE